MADGWDLFGGPPTAAAPVAAQPTAPPAGSADGWAAFGGHPSEDVPPPAAAPEPQSAQSRMDQRIQRMTLSPQEADTLVAGKDRALKDVIDRPAEWLASLFGQGGHVAEQNTADRQAYDAAYGNSPLAETGRLGGQVALTLPLASGLGALGEGAGDVLAAGAGKVAPLMGRAVQGATDFLSGTAGGSGGLGSRVVQGASVAANSGLQGGLAAGLTAGQSDQPLANQLLQGAELGAATGTAARGIAAGAGAVKDAIAGGEINPAVADLARTARDKYGIMLTADQITPSPFLRTVGAQAAQVPLSGMSEAKGNLQTQFTRAVAKTIGEDADQITPAVMEQAKSRIGSVRDNIASRTGVPIDSQFQQDLHTIAQDAMGSMPASERPLLQKQMGDILDMAKQNGGAIPGEGYQTLTGFRSNIGTSMRAGTPTMQEFSGRLKSAMDSALERAAVATGDTDAIDALRTANSQYKALKTIQPLVTKGAPGEITPTLLRGVVDPSYKGRGLRANQPDLGELADIGQRFNLGPDSGTARNAAAIAAMTTIGSAATQLFSGQPMNALMTAGAIPATMMGAKGATMYLTNPKVVNRLLTASPAGAGGPMNALVPYVAPAGTLAARNTILRP